MRKQSHETPLKNHYDQQQQSIRLKRIMSVKKFLYPDKGKSSIDYDGAQPESTKTRTVIKKETRKWKQEPLLRFKAMKSPIKLKIYVPKQRMIPLPPFMMNNRQQTQMSQIEYAYSAYGKVSEKGSGRKSNDIVKDEAINEPSIMKREAPEKNIGGGKQPEVSEQVKAKELLSEFIQPVTRIYAKIDQPEPEPLLEPQPQPQPEPEPQQPPVDPTQHSFPPELAKNLHPKLLQMERSDTTYRVGILSKISDPTREIIIKSDDHVSMGKGLTGLSVLAAMESPLKMMAKLENVKGTQEATEASKDHDQNGFSEVLETPKYLVLRGYRYKKLIDEGTYGKIYLAKKVSKDSGESSATYAIKQIDRTNPYIKPWLDNRCMEREMKVMMAVNHPNLVHALEVFKFRTVAFIVMPFIAGGNLRVNMYKQGRPYDELTAKKYFHDMAKGISYLHKNHIVHRDLKLDNLLIYKSQSDASATRLMISDFGFAKILSYGSKLMKQKKNKSKSGSRSIRNNSPQSSPVKTVPEDDDDNLKTSSSANCYSPCGTVEYCSPEVNWISMAYIEQRCPSNPSYDAKAMDVYSMGACLYEMLFFYKAFLRPSEYSIIDSKEKLLLVYPRQLSYSFTPNPMVNVSTQCDQMLRILMMADPKRRAKIDSVLAHEWLKKLEKWDKLKHEKFCRVITWFHELEEMNRATPKQIENYINSDDDNIELPPFRLHRRSKSPPKQEISKKKKIRKSLSAKRQHLNEY